MEEKIITRSQAKSKGLSRYYTGKLCRNGHDSERATIKGNCIACYKKYIEDNKDKIRIQSKCYREANKEKLKISEKAYRDKNKEKIKGYRENYKDKERANAKANRDSIRERKKAYNKANPMQYFIRGSLARISNNWKGRRVKGEELCGYTFKQLEQRIEFNFKPGMTWDNRGEWHVDHKKPISRFIKQGITDPKIINALCNLQPLWAKDNIKKSDKFKNNKV